MSLSVLLSAKTELKSLVDSLRDTKVEMLSVDFETNELLNL